MTKPLKDYVCNACTIFFYSEPASKPLAFPYIFLVLISKYGFTNRAPKHLFILSSGRLLMKMLSQAGINNNAWGNSPDAFVPLNKDMASFFIKSRYSFLGLLKTHVRALMSHLLELVLKGALTSDELNVTSGIGHLLHHTNLSLSALINLYNQNKLV